MSKAQPPNKVTAGTVVQTDKNKNREQPEARVREDVSTIMTRLYEQGKNQKGLLVMIPASVPLISNCALNLLVPNKHVQNKTTDDTCTFKGWLLVTSQANYKRWKSYRRRCNVKDDAHYTTPTFSILTYETIGMLNAVSGDSVDDTSKDDRKRTLLVFENAEYLIDILQKRPELEESITWFNKTLFFTNNLELGDFHTLLDMVDTTHTHNFPTRTSEAREQHQEITTSLPRTLNRMILEPSTRMMMQFVFLLGIVMNAKRIFNHSAESTAHTHYNVHHHRRRRRPSRSRKRFLPSPFKSSKKRFRSRKRHPTRKRHGGQPEGQAHTTATAIRHHTQKQGGFLPFLLPVMTTYTASLASGTFLFWLFSKNVSVAGTVANMLSFVFMLVPNIVKGVSIFIGRNAPHIEDACVNAYWNLASVVEGVDTFVHSSATRSGFIHVWRTIETIVMGFAKSILRLEEKDRGIIMAFFGFMCLAWLSSRMIRRFVYPVYEDSLLIPHPNKKDSHLNKLPQLIAVSCKKDIKNRNSQPFRKIKRRTVHYRNNTVKAIIQQTQELQEHSSPYARQQKLNDIVNLHIKDKFEQVKGKYNGLEKPNKRILVIVPHDNGEILTDKAGEDWKGKWNKDQCFVKLSVNDITSFERDDIPKWNPDLSQIKYPAHEIHFLSPPTNEERQAVVTMFAGILKDADQEYFKGPFGFKIAREMKEKNTQLYEYIRPFHWFAWLLERDEPETQMHPTLNESAKKKHTLKVKRFAQQAKASTHWLTNAVSSIQSPEELVMNRRKEVSHDCEQVRKILCKFQEKHGKDVDGKMVELAGMEIDDAVENDVKSAKGKIRGHNDKIKGLFKNHFEDGVGLTEDEQYTAKLRELSALHQKLGLNATHIYKKNGKN